jgi:hypothetical protein
MVRSQFALAIVVHQIRDVNSLRAQVRVIQIDFPAQRRDLEERRRFVGDLCGRTDYHPSMFPLAISSCLSPSKFPNIGTAQTSGSHDTSVLHKVSFLLLVLANQDFLVGLPLWQMKENQRCRLTVTEWL